MLIGAILIFPVVFIFYSGEMMMNTLFVVAVFLDWYLQKQRVYSSKATRMAVSVFAGYGLMSMIVMQTIFLFQIL